MRTRRRQHRVLLTAQCLARAVTLEMAYTNAAAIVDPLQPYMYDFSEGTSGTNIIDGGDDMYDNGNRLQVMAVGGR